MPRPRHSLSAGALCVVGVLCTAIVSACNTPSPPPNVVRVEPGTLAGDQNGIIIIEGHDFVPGATVELGSNEIRATWVNGSVIAGRVPAGLAPSTYDVTVRNPNGSSGQLTQALSFGPPQPQRASAGALPGQNATPANLAGSGPTAAAKVSVASTAAPAAPMAPTPAPTPTPAATAGPVSALEGIVCQPGEAGGGSQMSRQHESNAQVGVNDPAIGRLDGFTVSYAGAGQALARPATPFVTAVLGTTECTIELFQTPAGAALDLNAQIQVTGISNIGQVQAPAIGEAARAYEGSVDQRGATPAAVILRWQRGRLVGTVTVTAANLDQARSAGQRLAAAMDGRMSGFRPNP